MHGPLEPGRRATTCPSVATANAGRARTWRGSPFTRGCRKWFGDVEISNGDDEPGLAVAVGRPAAASDGPVIGDSPRRDAPRRIYPTGSRETSTPHRIAHARRRRIRRGHMTAWHELLAG